MSRKLVAPILTELHKYKTSATYSGANLPQDQFVKECVALVHLTTQCVPQVFIASQETTYYEISFMREVYRTLPSPKECS